MQTQVRWGNSAMLVVAVAHYLGNLRNSRRLNSSAGLRIFYKVRFLSCQSSAAVVSKLARRANCMGVGAALSASLASVAAQDRSRETGSVVGGGSPLLDPLADHSEPNAEFVRGLQGRLAVEPSPASWTARGTSRGAGLGSAIAVGDLDGDGFDDLVVSVESISGDGNKGDSAVYLFAGSKDGLGGEAQRILYLTHPQAFLGGRLAVLPPRGDSGGAGLAVGTRALQSPQWSQGFAHVYGDDLFREQAARPVWSARTGIGPQPRAYQPSAVDTAGDVNGDGRPDLLVGVYRFSDPQQNRQGVVFVYHGADESRFVATPSWLQWGKVGSREQYGFSAAGVGDVNGDGFDDVLVGAPGFVEGPSQWAGCTRLYLGSADGLSTEADWEFAGSQTYGRLGTCVAPAGDVDDDGFADVWVSAPGSRRKGSEAFEVAGRVLLFRGGVAGLGEQPALELEGERVNARFGTRVCTLGDIDGDGTIEVGVIESSYRDTDAPDHPVALRGKLHLFSLARRGGGSPGALLPLRQISVTGTPATPFVEAVLASRADFNGDGFADLAVASRRAGGDGSRVGGGQVTVVYGAANFLDALTTSFRGEMVSRDLEARGVAATANPSFPPLWLYLLGAGVLIGGVGIARSLRHRRERSVASSGQLIDVERKRIARALHDEVNADLNRIRAISTRIEDRRCADEIRTTAQSLIDGIKELSWASDPENDALSKLADYLSEHAAALCAAADVECELDFPLELPDDDVLPEVRLHLGAILKESLSNALRHGEPKLVKVRFARADGDALHLRVEDDGSGFDPATAADGSGMGLRSMRDRCAEIGAGVEIRSAPGGGTRVEVQVPNWIKAQASNKTLVAP